MGWELLAENSSGWKKWKDQWGNHRYQKSDGTFTNSNAWSASFTKEGVESIPTGRDDDVGVGVEVRGLFDRLQISNRDELESYKEAIDYIMREPFMWEGPKPIHWPPIPGIPIEDYPLEDRINQLEKIYDKYEFDKMAYGIQYVIHDEDSIVSRSERHTKLLEKSSANKTILKAAFETIISELKAVAAMYSGVVIQVTLVKGRDYYQ